ncbi:MAG: hypothetical protein RSE46_13295, partial [Janthinobacterium sp.]
LPQHGFIFKQNKVGHGARITDHLPGVKAACRFLDMAVAHCRAMPFPLLIFLGTAPLSACRRAAALACPAPCPVPGCCVLTTSWKTTFVRTGVTARASKPCREAAPLPAWDGRYFRPIQSGIAQVCSLINSHFLLHFFEEIFMSFDYMCVAKGNRDGERNEAATLE